MALSIDVVVPVFRGLALTRSCLRHVQAQTVTHRVIVVDDASGDDTPYRLQEEFPAASVLRQPVNAGFAAACNRGIAAGHGEVVVLLNSDVDCRPRFLERLVAPLAEDERLASVAPLLLRPGEATIDSLGLVVDPTLAGFPRLQGRPASAAGSAEHALVGPSGGAAAYRRTALDQVGGLDERIFMYSEDLDLALRLRAAGWGAAAAPEAIAVHLGSASSGRRSPAQRRTAGFSRGYLLRRYGILRGTAAPRTLLTELIVAGGDALISRDLQALLGRLSGWRAGRGAPARALPGDAVDRRLGFRASLRLRRIDYAVAEKG